MMAQETSSSDTNSKVLVSAVGTVLIPTAGLYFGQQFFLTRYKCILQLMFPLSRATSYFTEA